jgi:hypothetical protein
MGIWQGWSFFQPNKIAARSLNSRKKVFRLGAAFCKALRIKFDPRRNASTTNDTHE